jgi:acetolactate synthase-1/2/3 large subunit
MTVMTGAEIVIESLKKENVKDIFGYPGGAVIPIYDVLYDSSINHYLTRHEQGAAHAADGYARSTGKVGVCIATSGPGATNLITGLATAYMDSVPMVAFTGQVPTAFIGRDAFQEADIRGISLPVTKHNYLVTDVKDLAATIKEAFHVARSGRPGPVLIDLPKDVSLAETEFEYPETVNIEGYDYGENEVTIKNYSENEGILEVLIENGIVSEPKGYVDNGYVTVPVCDLLIEGEYIGYCKITS